MVKFGIGPRVAFLLSYGTVDVDDIVDNVFVLALAGDNAQCKRKQLQAEEETQGNEAVLGTIGHPLDGNIFAKAGQ
jgi:hypothetical protein